MTRWLTLFGIILVSALAAQAELCAQCKEGMYTADIGKCVACGGTTGSGAFKLCKPCSGKLGQCEHCRARGRTC